MCRTPRTFFHAIPAAKAQSMFSIHPGVRKSVHLAILMFVSLLNITKLFRDDMVSLCIDSRIGAKCVIFLFQI